MASVPYAHSNMQAIRSQHRKLQDVLKGAKLSIAPDPKDIVSSLSRCELTQANKGTFSCRFGRILGCPRACKTPSRA